MRDRGIDKGQQMILRQCLVVQDLLRNVDYLNEMHLLSVNEKLLGSQLHVLFAAKPIVLLPALFDKLENL